MSDRIQIFGVKLELSSNKTRSNRILQNRMTKMIILNILVANVVFALCCGYATHLMIKSWSLETGSNESRTINVRHERTLKLLNSLHQANNLSIEQSAVDKLKILGTVQDRKPCLNALFRQNPIQKIKSEVIKNGPEVIIWNWIQISWAGTQSFFLAQFMLWLFLMFS